MPVPQRVNFLVEQASCLFLRMVQHFDVAPFSISYLGTGKMPVPQRVNFLVEQASCLFLRMVQHLS
ncbi:hypothetical protein [Microcoleus sp. B5-D4]|uniref:hypothetical protein n=1 Tax=Microcoleus sp. B5-D4 TaxID=2818681 RepID=UPI002FD067BF